MERDTTKDTQIGEIKARFDKMTAAVFLDFKGMTVESVTKLRAEFRKARRRVQGRQEHARQARRSRSTPYERKLDDVLVGMTGIAWSYEDPSAAAKVVKAFRKDPAGEKLKIKAGLIDGSMLDAKASRASSRRCPARTSSARCCSRRCRRRSRASSRCSQAPAQNFVYLLAAKEREGSKGSSV